MPGGVNGSPVWMGPATQDKRPPPLLLDKQVDSLARGWKDCAGKPGMAATFAVYSYVRCQRAWELSMDYGRIYGTIDAAEPSFRRARTARDPAQTDPTETRLVELVLQHTGSLRYCLLADDAIQRSCPAELHERATRVVDESRALLAALDKLGPSGSWQEFEAFREFFRGVVRGDLIYYGALVVVAKAVSAWIPMTEADRPAVQRTIDQAVDFLARQEERSDVRLDVHASELRAHRKALAAVAERLADRDIPTVRIDEAKIIYWFPFTLEIDDKINDDKAAEWARNLAKLGPGRPVTVAHLELTDLWDPGGRHMPYYRVLEIKLPKLRVRSNASEVLPHDASIRLSTLGNHYLRVERTLRKDATLHDLNQVTRRASTEMGPETIEDGGHDEDGGPAEWERLPEYAQDMMEHLRREIAGLVGTPEQVIRHVEAEFHALLEIRVASVVEEDGGRRPADVDEFLCAAGPLLLQPLAPLASALEEWVRQRVPADPPVLCDTRFRTDRIIRTPNTTVLIMPASPNWALLVEYEELAEFIASLPPLLESWRERLERDAKVDITVLKEDQLDKRRAKLQEQIRHIRDALALLHSTDLCGTVFHRQLLDELWTLAGLPRVEDELKRTIDRTTALLEAMSSRTKSLQEDRSRHTQWFLQGVLAVLAVAGLAGVLSLINDVFVNDKHHVAWPEIGVLGGSR